MTKEIKIHVLTDPSCPERGSGTLSGTYAPGGQVFLPETGSGDGTPAFLVPVSTGRRLVHVNRGHGLPLGYLPFGIKTAYGFAYLDGSLLLSWVGRGRAAFLRRKGWSVAPLL